MHPEIIQVSVGLTTSIKFSGKQFKHLEKGTERGNINLTK